jgi:hypothetical protein
MPSALISIPEHYPTGRRIRKREVGGMIFGQAFLLSPGSGRPADWKLCWRAWQR